MTQKSQRTLKRYAAVCVVEDNASCIGIVALLLLVLENEKGLYKRVPEPLA